MIIQKINNQKGFTLIELAIAIAIIAILMCIAVPNFIALRNRQNANSEPVQIITQQEEKVIDEKAPSPPKQPEITKQKGEMNKL